ncbi:MAG: hypothetical protein JWO42_2537 [Chloroflexi bacterium]|jgi:hypothetical protein|nr:hypothetical protein [Chloroflexota bacterium]
MPVVSVRHVWASRIAPLRVATCLRAKPSGTFLRSRASLLPKSRDSGARKNRDFHGYTAARAEQVRVDRLCGICLLPADA